MNCKLCRVINRDLGFIVAAHRFLQCEKLFNFDKVEHWNVIVSRYSWEFSPLAECAGGWKKHFPTAYQEMFNGNDSFCSISQVLNNFPRLTSLYFFTFPNWPLKLNCTIRWQQSGVFEQLTSSESWKFFFATNKLQNTLDAPFTQAIYPLMFAAFIENPDSTTLTERLHIVLFSGYVVEFGRVIIYLRKRLPVTG